MTDDERSRRVKAHYDRLWGTDGKSQGELATYAANYLAGVAHATAANFGDLPMQTDDPA